MFTEQIVFSSSYGLLCQTGNCDSFVTKAKECATIAQLGERQTEDLKVPGSIPGRGNLFLCLLYVC